MAEWAKQAQAQADQVESAIVEERQRRESEGQQYYTKITELQDQIQEYQEECMSLQQQIYGYKLQREPSQVSSISSNPEQNFQELISGTDEEVQAQIRDLESEIKKVRAQFKKEEEVRRQMQDAARRRDEETK